jgi:MFS family permease
VAAAAANRVGVRKALVFGMVLLTGGLVYFTQISVGGSYWADLFPGFLIIGLGMPFCFVPITIGAVAGTGHDEAGLASGLINTSQQIGGALGIAVLSTVAISYTEDLLAGGTSEPTAAVEGFQRAFWVGAVIAFVGVLASIFLVRDEDIRVSEPSLEPATETV